MTYSRPSSASTSAGSELPSRSGVMYRVMSTVRSMPASVVPASEAIAATAPMHDASDLR